MPRTRIRNLDFYEALFALFALAALNPMPAHADDVPAGSDMFITPDGGGTFVNLGDPDALPIPAGFFGPGSNPFAGSIPLTGAPLVCTVPCAGVDTIVERLADAILPIGGSDTVPIQIRALHLVSSSPIQVNFTGGGSSIYNVAVFLSEVCPQGIGSMTINHEFPDGGTFTSQLPVTAKLVFTKVSGVDGVPAATLDPPDCSRTDVFTVPPPVFNAPLLLRSSSKHKINEASDANDPLRGVTCSGLPPGSACGDDGNGCTPGVCDEVGNCVHTNQPDGTPCGDGLFCMVKGSCQNGSCTGGCPCEPSQVCNEDMKACVSASGWWSHMPHPGDTIYAVPAGDADHDGDGFIVEPFGGSPFAGNNPLNFNVGPTPQFLPIGGCDPSDMKLTTEQAAWAAHGVGPPNRPPPPPNNGACCDHSAPGGVCTDGVLPSGCIGDQKQFFKDQMCDDVECEEHTGACCVAGVCTDQVFQSQCASPKWYKETPCSDPEVAAICDAQADDGRIPTVSEWGLVVLTLLLLVGAKAYFGLKGAKKA